METKNEGKSTETRASSSARRRAQTTTVGSATLLDNELLTEEETATFFKELQVSSSANPRSFPYSVKQQCWEKAEKVRGRDPDRWREDALGNTVFRKLLGCPGCLCHDYDHILPYSKGGGKHTGKLSGSTAASLTVPSDRFSSHSSTAKITCEVYDLPYQFQIVANLGATVNRSKGNRTELSRSDLIQKSSYCRVSGRDMDLLELSAYGSVRRGQDSGGCRIQ